MRLEGRTAVIVGAGQTPGQTIGNGRATALLFAREGARLLLTDVDETGLEETRQLIRQEGFDAEIEVASVLEEADCRRVVERAVGSLGRIDIAHYNVGKGYGGADPSRESLEEWDSIMDVNLRGFFLTAKYVVPAMCEQGGGVIVAISSVAAVTPGGALSYRASKLGLNGLVQSMAVKHGPEGIRVNAIMPGLLDTPMVIEAQAERRGVSREVVRRERDEMVPLNRKMGTAWDVAHAALFLASDEAAHVSGIVLPVDGALSAQMGG